MKKEKGREGKGRGREREREEKRKEKRTNKNTEMHSSINFKQKIFVINTKALNLNPNVCIYV
jgi:hypothetical protein